MGLFFVDTRRWLLDGHVARRSKVMGVNILGDQATYIVLEYNAWRGLWFSGLKR